MKKLLFCNITELFKTVTMTVKEKAGELGVQAASLRKRLARKGIALSVNDELTKEALEVIEVKAPEGNHPPLQLPIDRIRQSAGRSVSELKAEIHKLERRLQAEKESVTGINTHLLLEIKEREKLEKQLIASDVVAEEQEQIIIDLEEKLKVANEQLAKEEPLPWYMVLVNAMPNAMIGLAASYGVYHYSSHFMPTHFAYIEAAAFEFVYIRLTSMKDLPDRIKGLARKVSLGAVIVSVIYNTISARMYTNPEWIDQISSGPMWILNALHGLPLALIGYYLVEVIFHEKR